MPLNTRLKKWVDASLTTAQIDGPLVPIIHGLGFLDIKLIATDSLLIKHAEEMKSESQLMQLNEHLTMSYLWVLGAYEAIRTICQKAKSIETFSSSTRISEFESAKKAFNRVRIPLAKLEAASGYKESDYHMAIPVLNEALGTGWQVNSNTFIIRSELSDLLLSTLEQSRAIDKQLGAS